MSGVVKQVNLTKPPNERVEYSTNIRPPESSFPTGVLEHEDVVFFPEINLFVGAFWSRLFAFPRI